MSIRNNEDRLGAKKRSSDPPIPAIENQTIESTPDPSPPPLSFSTPTEMVDLPSEGLFYPPNHPLHKQETVEIRYMTAKDEDILTSKSLLKKGVAIDRFLQNIIMDKRVRVEDLLTGDKNALIVAARITGYGANYETKLNCPSCGEHVQSSFDLEDAAHIQCAVPDDVDRTQKGTFIAVTPQSKVQVELRLLTGADEKKLAKAVAFKKKKNLPESSLSDQLRLAIVSVNGDGDPQMINLFIGSLAAREARYLREIYAKLMPNIDMKQDFICNTCGYEQELEVPFTSDFFWPK